MNPGIVGKKIAQKRKELQLTQRELANLLYVSDKAVSKWENGINYPDTSLLAPLADILHISVAELLGLEDKTVEEAIKATADISTQERIRIRKRMRGEIFFVIIISILIFIVSHYISTELSIYSNLLNHVHIIQIFAFGLIICGVRLAILYGLSNKRTFSERTTKTFRIINKAIIIIAICCIAVILICALLILHLFGVF